MSYEYPFDDFLEIWESGPLVIKDTNGILHLYRFSPKTTDHMLMVLNKISDQIWIPFQVLNEYNENRESVINREYKTPQDIEDQCMLLRT